MLILLQASSRSSSRSSVNSCDDNRLDGKKDDKLGKDLLPKDLKKRQLMFRDLMKNHKKQKLINKVHSTKKINKSKYGYWLFLKVKLGSL